MILKVVFGCNLYDLWNLGQRHTYEQQDEEAVKFKCKCQGKQSVVQIGLKVLLSIKSGFFTQKIQELALNTFSIMTQLWTHLSIKWKTKTVASALLKRFKPTVLKVVCSMHQHTQWFAVAQSKLPVAFLASQSPNFKIYGNRKRACKKEHYFVAYC